MRQLAIAAIILVSGLAVGLYFGHSATVHGQSNNMQALMTGIQNLTAKPAKFEVAFIFTDGTSQLVGNLSRDATIETIADDYMCLKGTRPALGAFEVCAPYTMFRMVNPGM